MCVDVQMMTEPFCRNSSASAYIVDVFPPPPISAVIPGLMSKKSHKFCTFPSSLFFLKNNTFCSKSKEKA